MSSGRQLLLFFCAAACMSLAIGVHDSIFNNFLSDTFGLSAAARGGLEFPREFPGLMVVAMTGALSGLAVTSMGVVGALVFSTGMIGLATWASGGYFPMLAAVMIGSAGLHLLQPVTSSIALSLGDEKNRGRRMGQMGAVMTIGTVLGTGGVWLTFDRAAPGYRTGFLFAAAIPAIVAVLYYALHIPHLGQRRQRMVWRRKFLLYYLLEFLFGARKQVFLTFGFWVLIKVYDRPASGIAGLLMISSLIGIAWKPAVGWAIDHFGERTIMIADGLLVSAVCVGYGYARHMTDNLWLAGLIASGCFIADDMLFALGNSRSVYVSRLADSPQEMTSTLAMGVSVNHIASMLLPMIGGVIWERLGYERVFAAAGVLAIVTALVATRVPRWASARA